MFDGTLFELVNSTKRDELEDIVCEAMTICDELKVGLSEERGLGFFEDCARQSAYELMLDNCRDELARLALSSNGALRTIRWSRRSVRFRLRGSQRMTPLASSIRVVMTSI